MLTHPRCKDQQGNDPERVCFTEVKVGYWEFFRTDGENDYFAQASPQVRNRYCFDLAILLLHELTHIVFQHRPDHVPNQEVLYSRHDRAVELGHSRDKYFFGGRLGCIQNPLRSAEHSRAMWTDCQPACTCEKELDLIPFNRFHGVTAASINQFFLRQRWEDHHRSMRRAVRSHRGGSDKDSGVEGSSILQLTPNQTVGLDSKADPNFDELFSDELDYVRSGQGDFLQATIDELVRQEHGGG
jgi:hypothetical protein